MNFIEKNIFIECDVTVTEQVKAAIEQTVKTFGSIDVALNNAGIGGGGERVGEMDEADWNSVIHVNLTSVWADDAIRVVVGEDVESFDSGQHGQPGHIAGVQGRPDRQHHAAVTVLGGHDGAPHDYTLLPPDGPPRKLKSKEINVPVPPGSVIHVLSGGGGGWGDPARRDPAARARDAAEGLT